MYRPSDYSEDKTPEDVFRARYDLPTKKLFQKAVWDLHTRGVPLKEAESMVAQEAFIQSERRKRVPAKETSIQLSFPKEQGSCTWAARQAGVCSTRCKESEASTS